MMGNSRLCSRRFVRNLFLSIRLPVFLTTVPAILADSFISPEYHGNSVKFPITPLQPVEDKSDDSSNAFEKAFLKSFLPTKESG